MDVKQFDLFQRTLQFAKDEMTLDEESDTHFNMNTWLVMDKGEFDKLLDKAETIVLPDAMPGEVPHIVMPEIPAGACNTAACLAGTGVMLHGEDRFVIPADDDDVELPGVVEVDFESVVTRDGRTLGVEQRAVELFGISTSEGESLFYMIVDDLDDMESMIKKATTITERYGHTLEII